MANQLKSLLTRRHACAFGTSSLLVLVIASCSGPGSVVGGQDGSASDGSLDGRAADAGDSGFADGRAETSVDASDATSDTGGDARDGVSCTPNNTPEICNGRDDNCNGTTDEGIAAVVCGSGACQRSVVCTAGAMPTCMPGMPRQEVCDGVDNDCNSAVDDGLGTDTCGVGSCARTVDRCQAGTMVACTPRPMSAETCNGLDDDCNGITDDGLGSATCGIGTCRRTVPNCVSGAPATCTPGESSAEICDGLDNNCDGNIDEGLGTTSCGMGECRRVVQNCMNGHVATCAPGSVGTEVCNGLDDNCDGQTDEDQGVSTCGVGSCQRQVLNCVSGAAQTCVSGPSTPERCNGIDDDCDGIIDNNNPGGGGGCNTMLPGVCAPGTQICMNGALLCVSNTLSSPEACNGLDDDCNGVTDEGNPEGGGECSVSGARGACAPGTLSCGGSNMATPGRLTCVADRGPSAETCNGVDDNCDGVTDENLGTTTCGRGICARTVTNCVLGQPITCRAGDPAAEVCNGRDDNCDGSTDEAGSTLCPAYANTNASTTACVQNAAAMTAACSYGCTAGYYNVDGNISSNGCECQDDTSAATCAAATNLGTFSNLSATINRDGSIPFAGGEDWYTATFPANNDPNLHGSNRITVALNQVAINAGYRLDFRTSCASTTHVVCGAGTTDPGAATWTTLNFQDTSPAAASAGGMDGVGDNNFSQRDQPWPTTLYIHVTRPMAAVRCDSYTLNVTRDAAGAMAP